MFALNVARLLSGKSRISGSVPAANVGQDTTTKKKQSG